MNKMVQLKSMDSDLRTGLWNVFSFFFMSSARHSQFISGTNDEPVLRGLWIGFFKRPMDEFDIFYKNTLQIYKDWFFSCEWNEVYDFLEYSVNFLSKERKEGFHLHCNQVLSQERSGYRMVNKKIAAISDQGELDAISEALVVGDQDGFIGIKKHLESALLKLSDRINPDYRNSIKESISAVESLLKVLTKKPHIEFNDAMNELGSKFEFHPAFKKALCALFGYTSNEGGIRHAIFDIEKSTYDEAKFMLVTCSALVNYLISKTGSISKQISSQKNKVKLISRTQVE